MNMIEEETVVYCANHPKTETTLRCRQCDKPICAKCAVLTPTGYKCKECVASHQKLFETAVWTDYVLASTIAAILAFMGSLLARYMGFFTIFIAPVAGVIIAEAVRAVTRRRRSRLLYQITTAATALGSLPWLLIIIFAVLGSLASPGVRGFGGLFSLLWQGVYTFIVTSTVYYRLAGISIR